MAVCHVYLSVRETCWWGENNFPKNEILCFNCPSNENISIRFLEGCSSVVVQFFFFSCTRILYLVIADQVRKQITNFCGQVQKFCTRCLVTIDCVLQLLIFVLKHSILHILCKKSEYRMSEVVIFLKWSYSEVTILKKKKRLIFLCWFSFV